MNKREVMQLLPHRDNMLLVDSVELEDGAARGSYAVSGDEWFLKGHFPGNPVVPGVILCEMLAQPACVLLKDQSLDGVTPMFSSLSNVRFKNSVVPGDTFESQCRIVKSKGAFYFCEGKGYVDGKLCVTAEFSFALVRTGNP